MRKSTYQGMWSFLILNFLVFSHLPVDGQSIIESEVLEEISQNQLTISTGVIALNGIVVYKVKYATLGSDNLPDTASGLVVLPDDTTITRIVAYQHGTTDGREDVPSRNNSEALLSKALAGQGYLVTAADYLGLGDSRGFHPYVHAATEASAGIDLLLAGMDLASQVGFQSMQQIFVTGYSQGGHAAMAMARALQNRETDDLFITAAAPMSGPYSISGVILTVIIQDSVEYFFPAYAAYTVLGYQEIYGNLYDSLPQVFKPGYLPMIQSFYAGDITLSALNNFLVSQLITDYGKSIPSKFFQDEYLAAIVSDSLHPLNFALKDNDTYQWVPEFPLRMFYCMADDQVNFMNSVVAEKYMKDHGAADVAAIDVFPNGDHGDCVLPAVLSTLAFFNGFEVSTAVARPSLMSNVRMYPNPASNLLTVEMPEGEISLLEVYNHLGQIILTQNNYRGEGIDVSGLPEGVFELILVGKQHARQGKFVIQR